MTTTDTPALFDASHTNPMGWEEFHTIVSDLATRLLAYQRQHGFTFDAVAPLLRSGAIPGTMLASKLRVVPMVPLQIKHDYAAQQVGIKLRPAVPDGLDAAAPLNILVAECNTYTGRSARAACTLLRETFPNARLHYACVTKVYGGPERIADYDSQHIGVHTDEAFKGKSHMDLRPGITIFPWETVEHQLEDANAPNSA